MSLNSFNGYFIRLRKFIQRKKKTDFYRISNAFALSKQVVQTDHTLHLSAVFVWLQPVGGYQCQVDAFFLRHFVHQGLHPLPQLNAIFRINGERFTIKLYFTKVYHIVGPVYEQIYLMFSLSRLYHPRSFRRTYTGNPQFLFNLSNMGKTKFLKGKATPCV